MENREIKFRAWDGKKMTTDFLIGPDNGNVLLLDTLPFTVSRMPLMQYTGLKDKNGKEIYEGDIMQDDKQFKHCVEMNYDQWKLKSATGWYSSFQSQGGVGNFEVIGNIYENPELLKNNYGK